MKEKLAESPFKTGDGRADVVVSHGEGAYENARAVLSQMDLSPARGKRVLLKPNAGRIAGAGSGITTDPQVVAAAIDVFQEAGADVSVGDSPITGIKALDALAATGISAVAEERDCSVLDLDERDAVEVDIPDGQAITRLKVCAEVLEHDIVVSMPVMKIHMHTGVTLAVKNMKGCLWRRSKVDLHMLPNAETATEKALDIAIADMSSVLKPHFSIIDGTVGMEGLGPSAGKPRKLDVVLAAVDPFAADAAACRLMGRRAENIPHLRIGAGRGYGLIDLEKISVSPEEWQERAVEFEAAPENLSIEFPNVNILDEQSCSSCQSTLLLFLQRHGDELSEYIPEGEVLNIAIGKGHEAVPEGTLCVGNCTVAHKDRGRFVAGCPPVGSRILDVLKGEDDKEI